MTLQVLLQDHSHPLPTSRLPESALPLEYRLEIPNGLQTKSETALIRFAARHGLEVAYFDFKCLEATRWVNAVVQQKPIRVPVPKYCLVSPHQGRLPSIKYTIDGSRANVRSLDSSETHLLNVVNLGLRKRFPAQTPIYALSLLMGLAVSVAFNFGLKTYKLGPVGWAVFFTMTMSSFFAMSWIADRFLTRPCVEFVATAQLPGTIPERWRGILNQAMNNLGTGPYLAYEATWDIETATASELDPLVLLQVDYRWYCLGHFDFEANQASDQTEANPA